MKDVTEDAFKLLFKDAFRKCFGFELLTPVSETEAKHFSNQLFDATGLVVGAKTLKNYSLFVLNATGKHENPSVATIDTLARFVLSAPYTDEPQRKEKEAHYPYWYKYRNNIAVEEDQQPVINHGSRKFSSPKKLLAAAGFGVINNYDIWNSVFIVRKQR